MRRKKWGKKVRAAILESHDGRCAICGWPIRGNDFDLDHIIPLAIGGPDDVDNLRPVHRSCHRRKTAEEDAPTIAKVRRILEKFGGGDD